MHHETLLKSDERIRHEAATHVDLTITTTHRTALRLLPTSLEFLARQQLAHVVTQLVDAGLVDCCGGLYVLTDAGRRLLAAHERARADAALTRWRERMGAVLVEVDALEREIREQHNHDLGQWHTWLVRGVEVLTRQARETLYTTTCQIQAHLGVPK